MSTIRAIGAALMGTVAACSDLAPPADPAVVRELLYRAGLARRTATTSQVQSAVRRFQLENGLTADGVAGPATVSAIVRYVRERHHVRTIDIAA
ncbi:hypothetical protein Val02_73150 [Virgisporangium aliadipatigenens]|uniref:Peptidoglycan binding-like domain-containing protein n=1 Tax=Virgisporangium aliadipatigenens TaxID=741659 RepID=A0A8J3YRN1_9ACTN|nr:peptidoglycan-binding domain-containing protein [Virgisporangium aliadipatigenens]GIJ50429.1 hypothetical protein Val02_73150 [Virgisporangium aliadipatigenens]